VFPPEPTGEAAVLPRVIEVEVSIVPAGIMSEPSVVAIHARHVPTSGRLRFTPPLFASRPPHFDRRRTVRGDVATAEGVTATASFPTTTTTTATLGEGGMRSQKQNDE
jgi:hypothetical protein